MFSGRFQSACRPGGYHDLSRLAGLSLLAGLVFVLACGLRKDPELAREEKIVAGGIEILRSGTPVERDSTIRTFFTIKNTNLLLAHLENPDPNVQIGVVSALGYIKDKSSAPALNRMLNTASDYLLRETIIYALGEICDTSSVSVLIGLLKDKTAERDLRLSLPITLASFHKTEMADLIEQTFMQTLREQDNDIELCSYVAVGILEILSPQNIGRFREYLPQLRRMAEARKAEFGEDGIWTNLDLTIQELESFQTPAT